MEMDAVKMEVEDSEEVDGGVTNPMHQCPKCSRSFSNIGHMKCHFYRVHPEFRLADCVQSTAKSPKKATNDVYNPDLIIPDKKNDSGKTLNSIDDTSYQCGLCDKQFTTKSVLVKHTLSEHAPPENTHTCKFCKKKFSTQASLAKHLRTHNKRKKKRKKESSDSEEEWEAPEAKKKVNNKLTCEVCNKSFNHASILESHQKTHAQEKSYPCDLCNLTFKNSHYLTLHYRTHTSDKPHVCETCNAEFAVKSSLDAHYSTHTDYLMHFACEICDAVFTDEQSLKEHLIVHISTKSEKPFACELCDRQFTRKCHFIRHLNTHES